MNVRMALVSLCSLIASPVFAQTFCQTTSAGQVFEYTGLGSIARQVVIDRCKTNPRTNNVACEQNVACTNGYEPSISCQTTSAGIVFEERGNPAIARQLVIDRCKTNPKTNNVACQDNVACDDGMTARMVCQTTSAGRVFEGTGLGRVATEVAVGTCQQDPRTNNVACRENVVCESTHSNIDGARTNPAPRIELGNNDRGGSTPTVQGSLCYVRQTHQWLKGDDFFSEVSQWAQRNNRCAVAKIATVSGSGRIYNRDGRRVAKNEKGLSNSEVDLVLSASGLIDCERFSCEQTGY